VPIFKGLAPISSFASLSSACSKLRHAYHATDVNIVWDTIQNHLPQLKVVVERRIKASE
jgi:uncharacterized protein with HEPN domain